jgi:di/tricarboxylate transporter
MLFAVAPAEVVFSGFQSTALWLVFAGMVIGVAVGRTGLGARLAETLARRFTATYPGVIAGIVLVSVLLSFVMPSAMSRCVLLIPLTMALAKRLGFEHDSNGFFGMVMAVALGNFLPAMGILPANIPNMVLIGTSESVYGIFLQYGVYLLLHFPVLGLVKAVMVVGLIVWLYPARLEATAERVTLDPLSRDEKILALLLVGALALWATDSLHHVSPAWVALAAAIIILLPGVELVPAKVFLEKVNFGSLIYLAGILGIGNLVSSSGLGDHLAAWLLGTAGFAPGHDGYTFGVVSLVSAALGLISTQPGIPAVMVPLAGDIAAASGLPVTTVLMMTVVGFSTLILPYQAPPVIVALGMAEIPAARAIKLCLVSAVISIVFLMPLDWLWWRALGWLG